MGSVNPFRLPELPIDHFRAFSPDALIGPVWNHGFPGQPNEAYGFEGQFWDPQGMFNRAQNSITILEGNSKDIKISIGQQPSSDVTVTITGLADTDLTVSRGTLTFTASDWADKTVTLTAGDDDDKINDELTLSITSPGSFGNSSQVAVTIVDDEIIWELTPKVVREGGREPVYIFLLESLGPPTGDVAFTVTGHEGTNLVPRPTILTFPADDWQENQGLHLLAKLDEDDEDERVPLTFTASGGGYDGLTYSLDVTIEDRRPFERLIPEGRSIFIGLALGSPDLPQSDLIAEYTGYEGTDLTVSPSTVTYPVDSWYAGCAGGGRSWTWCSPPRNVKVTAGHDLDDEDDQEALIFTITGPPSEPGFVGVSGKINVRIEDDDDPGLEVSPSSLGIAEGGSETFSVRLSEAPVGDFGKNDVTVSIPQSQGDLTASPSSLTFTSENWKNPQDVELTAGHDSDFLDDSEEFVVTASGGGFDRERGIVSVAIFDDEVPAIETNPTSVSVNEESSSEFTVKLSAEPQGKVTVQIPKFANPDLTP